VPVNVGPPIRVTIAFYDGLDPGSPDGTCANGAMFHEAADDDYFDFSFDMGSKHDVLRALDMLSQRGYIVGNIYFYDHCHGAGLEFGNSVLEGTSLQQFCIDMGGHEALANDAIVHFRQCLVASTLGGQLIKNLATWTKRPVTGGTMLMCFDSSRCPRAYNPALEMPGSDYWIGISNSGEPVEFGELHMAKPILGSGGEVVSVDVSVYYTVTSTFMEVY
jgi:hypothetical protein